MQRLLRSLVPVAAVLALGMSAVVSWGAPESSTPPAGVSASSTPGERYACKYPHHFAEEPVCGPEDDFLPEKDADDHAHPHMEKGLYEVTRFYGREPTAEQQRAADEFAERALEAVKARGWFDIEKAMADGYKLRFREEVHHYNEEFVFDDRVLDPERPEYLMFQDTSNGKRLSGAMFTVPGFTAEGEQIGGPLTQWHYHVWRSPFCFLGGRLMVADAVDGKCSEGVPSLRSVEMLHVWFLDHPRGTYASQMGLPPKVMDRLVKKRGGW